jgi:hypothetical protein
LLTGRRIGAQADEAVLSRLLAQAVARRCWSRVGQGVAEGGLRAFDYTFPLFGSVPGKRVAI